MTENIKFGMSISDELTTCSLRQFTCGNKKCIPISYACDGQKDCEDGLDEDPDTCLSKWIFNAFLISLYNTLFQDFTMNWFLSS